MTDVVILSHDINYELDCLVDACSVYVFHDDLDSWYAIVRTEFGTILMDGYIPLEHGDDEITAFKYACSECDLSIDIESLKEHLRL